MREVLPNIFIDIIEYNKVTGGPINVCIIKTNDRSLLVDAGTDPQSDPIYKEHLELMLEELHIDYTALDVIITHAHIDHIGLATMLEKKGARILAYPEEMKRAMTYLPFSMTEESERESMFRTMGVIQEEEPVIYDELWQFAKDYINFRKYSLDFHYDDVYIGDVLSYGDYNFELVPLKGHTFGQMGLYDKKKNVFFCADHIMKKVSPIVGSLYGYDVYFADYLNTMSKIKHVYEGAVFIPGHGQVFIDASKEADRIIYSYLDKASAMYDLLRRSEERMTIRSIGAAVYGRDVMHPKPEQFASCVLIWEKTYGLLRYMENQNLVTSFNDSGTVRWEARR